MSERENLLDRLLVARFRRICRRNSGFGSGLAGYAGAMDQVRQIAAAGDERRRAIIDADLRDLFSRPVLAVLRPVARRWPDGLARVVVRLMPAGFRWLVGPIAVRDATTIKIPRCRFLAEGGADACLRVCRTPTASFFAEQVGLRAELRPDLTAGSCTIRFGTSAVSR
ncbi:beta-carotene isomerase domain-containing protein [Lentzea jiangxiensis]|uniref:Beta-carotene isomerase D27-like C-terminal domain-containing protein n=1 Tax=Lentzea jiangxiensis TaxID=641025 RepID=A0A1H0X3K1_9PSEU|nr:beta-carotene isomerase domain-containing protein [Lentzea jiangxiensis]SDP97538.1 protein of unknown function [Lentzea jiangxiensis]